MVRVVCAIISRGSQFLITQRPASKAEPLLWEFPGGKLEAGETEAEAVVREIDEELGISVRPLQRLGAVVHHTHTASIELIAWQCEWLAGSIVLHEHAGSRWIGVEDLDKYDFSAADVFLLRKIHPSLRRLGQL